MRAVPALSAWLPLLAIVAAVWPAASNAQGFAADYELRIAKTSHARAEFSGAGLSLQAGRHWFAQVGMGDNFHYQGDMMNVGGGYRWNDGQSLSMQLSRGRGPDQRLGLAVSYDWPRYFVRMSYDTRLAPVPQDNFRFSAGIRF